MRDRGHLRHGAGRDQLKSQRYATSQIIICAEVLWQFRSVPGTPLALQPGELHAGLSEAHVGPVADVQSLLLSGDRVFVPIPESVITLRPRDAQTTVLAGVGQFVSGLHARYARSR